MPRPKLPDSPRMIFTERRSTYTLTTDMELQMEVIGCLRAIFYAINQPHTHWRRRRLRKGA